MRLALRIAVSVGVLALLLLLLPWSELGAAIGRLSPLVWAGALAGFLTGHRLGVLKWRTLVNAGRAGLDATDALRCYAAGLFANLCLPTIVGGDVLRAALAGRATRRPEAAVLGGIGDRLLDVGVLGLLIVGGGLLSREALPGWGAQALTLGIVVGLTTGVVLFPLLLRRPLRAWPPRLRRPLGRGLVALRKLARSPRPAAIAAGLSLVIQTAFVLLNAWIGRSIGIDVPLAAWFLVWPLAKTAGLLPISLGGLGVRDATLGALLAPLGVPIATGVVASLIWQSVLIAGGLIAGLLWLLLRRRDRVGPPSGIEPATAEDTGSHRTRPAASPAARREHV